MILNEFNIQSILKEIKADEPRRSEAFKNFQVYEEELAQFVTEKVKKKYPRTWEDYTIADYNILKKVVDKKAKSYKRAPLRKLDKQIESDRYNALLKEFDFDSAMKLIDRYHNQYKYCALGIIRDRVQAEDGIKNVYNFWALQPFEFVVIRDANENIVCWAIPTGKNGEHDNWTLWTNENHVRISTKDYSSFSVNEMPGNPDNINPFRVMPFIYVPADISGRYPSASSLVTKAIEINANLSIYLTSGNMQIGQLVIKHPKGQKIGEITTGLRVAMDLPQEGTEKGATDASYISPSPNLEGHKDSILFYMLLALDENGITSSKIGALNGESFTSGFDRLIAQADVQDIIEDNQTHYAKVENRAYKIIRAIHLADGDLGFSSKGLNITYLQPEILLSDSDKLENLRKKQELGLWHKWELIKEANPNLSEEEAKAKAEELKNANQQNRSFSIDQAGDSELG